MSIAPKKYGRKTFEVAAIRVTAENTHEVAMWCGGKVVDAGIGAVNSAYVKVPISLPKNGRPDSAFVGNWVLHTNNGFSVYTHKGFQMSFSPRKKENTFGDVVNLVEEAMSRQDLATYHGHPRSVSGTAEDIAHRIFELL